MVPINLAVRDKTKATETQPVGAWWNYFLVFVTFLVEVDTVSSCVGNAVVTDDLPFITL